MPTYKLYYFNARGRAEHCRLIFAAAGVQYEDVRFTQEQWAVEKPKAPFNLVPFMEVDGKRLAQSRAMARYLANEFGLAGSDSFEKAKVDEAAECVLDIAQDLASAVWSPTDPEKAMNEFVTKTWPSHQVKIGKIFERNPAKRPKYLVGEKLTFADLALMTVVDNLRTIPGITLTEEMEENVKKVSEVPNVAKWLKVRPQTQF